MKLFEFIKDPKIKNMCERDFEELEKVRELKLPKSSLILIGSLIESILYYSIISSEIYTLQLKNFEKRSEKSITLEQLLADSLNVKLISNEMFQNLKSIQMYRNFIHPNVYIKMESNLNLNIINNSYFILLELIRSVSLENKNELASKVNNIFNELLSRNPNKYEKYIYGALLRKYSNKVVIEFLKKEVLK